MSLLLLDRAQLEVRAEGETLALYEAGQRRGTVPIKLIERCVIHGAQTRLDSGVLMKLAEAGATTVLMSPRQTRRVAIVLGPHHNDAAVRLAQATRVLDNGWCERWALDLVRAKLARQLRALRTLQTHRPDARKPLLDAIASLQAALGELPGTSDLLDDQGVAPSLANLRGREGAAARAYFGGLSAVMPPAMEFTGRNRRPPRDPVNVGLSLGYTLLHALAVQACSVAGLDPLLGFYHRPSFGRESLASDLIEPLRPAVDLWLWEQLRTRELRADDFSMDKGACLLGKAGRARFYASWEAHARPWQRWLRQRAQRLAAVLRTEGTVWLDTAELDDEIC